MCSKATDSSECWVGGGSTNASNKIDWKWSDDYYNWNETFLNVVTSDLKSSCTSSSCLIYYKEDWTSLCTILSNRMTSLVANRCNISRASICMLVAGVKLPDGFGSCFKHKVTDNDTNITGLKSHDCHIMMQRLLPYGLQNYLPDKIAKPIIELCSLFKQICSTTLMEDDMLKAQIKVVDILCDLELIYPPALFDIMVHLVIHLPLEALEGGPIRPRWMYPFERYMKKLKGYVRNKAKPEGSIAEGYVAEEALTFSSHYFRDVTTKFNRPDRNVDPPPPTCQFQVFRSVCKSIGLRSVIRFDAQELKKVKCLFPNKDMKEEFPEWFGSQIRQRHVDNDKDPEVSTTSELFTLAVEPTWTPISINSCVVDGVRYVVHSRDERRTTQNSGICSPGPDEEMYYEDDPDIIHFDNSSDLPLSTSLNDLDNATLHIDGQSTEVDAPPDIIDVVDQDDDITDDEDALPHDLADSDDEDLINVDDDGVDKMSADVARSHGGDGGDEDRPLTPKYPVVGCFAKQRLNTRDKTGTLLKRNHGYERPRPQIRFELRDKQKTVMPLPVTAALLVSYLGRSLGCAFVLPFLAEGPEGAEGGAHYRYWVSQFDLRPHMKSRLDKRSRGHTGSTCKRGGHVLRTLRRKSGKSISSLMILGTFARAAAKFGKAGKEHGDISTGIPRQSSGTQEYPSLIDTFFVAHTVNGEFLRDEDRRIYDEMRRLEATSTYTDDEINLLARRDKQRGHIPDVGRVLPARATAGPSTPASKSTLNSLHKKVDFMMSLFKSDSKYSDMFSQFESGGASGSGECGDDEESADAQDDEDEDGDDDS
ncbi:putative reverse transcriptase domain, ribonuclease H-like domain, aspartic peptidase domain protein [Tanacetum coccineum]